MISRQELRELAAHKFPGALCTTLYLTVDPAENPNEAWLRHYKSLLKTSNSLNSPDLRSAAQDNLKRIESFLADRPEGTRRAMAILSCASDDFWWVYHSMVPIRNELVIRDSPYLTPLVQQIDIYQRYLIVIVGGNEARLFITGMGLIEPVFHVERPEVHFTGSRSDTWSDLGKMRAGRKREIALMQMLKGAAAAMEDILESEQIKRVLLGGPDTARARFREVLPHHFASHVSGEFLVNVDAGETEILARATPVMKDVERSFERLAMEELFHRLGQSGGGGVLGLSDVLTALQQGNVRKLYVLIGSSGEGMSCQRCGALVPTRSANCPYCEGTLAAIGDIHDLAVRSAIEQGARVDMLEQAPGLEKGGGIAALLRY
ncbi:MAG: hypothetical protein FJY67_08195 [Calditrichaeota bacterium]|nr:hypothetical protein [Calditrichota bacterium]